MSEVSKVTVYRNDERDLLVVEHEGGYYPFTLSLFDHPLSFYQEGSGYSGMEIYETRALTLREMRGLVDETEYFTGLQSPGGSL